MQPHLAKGQLCSPEYFFPPYFQKQKTLQPWVADDSWKKEKEKVQNVLRMFGQELQVVS